MRSQWLICLALSLMSLTACQSSPLDKALQGKFPREESNTVITEYCQSCHIHRAFDPGSHAPRMRALYDRLPYTATTQCRACHLVREDTWGTKLRKTIWPAQVAQNRFSRFERRFLADNPGLRPVVTRVAQDERTELSAARATPKQGEPRWVLIENPYYGDEKATEEPEYIWVREEKLPRTLKTLIFGKKSILAPPRVVAEYGAPPGGGKISPLHSSSPQASGRAAMPPPAARASQPSVSPEMPLKGYVVHIQQQRVMVDLTAADGVQPGSMLSLRRGGTPLIHPVTGEKLGELDEEIGTARVIELREHFSIAEIVEIRPGLELQVKDRAVLKQE